MPNGIIKRKGHFKSDEAAKEFVDSWNRAFRKKRGTAVLEDDFEFMKLQMNNDESQFLETRKQQRSVIAGAWGVPPHLVGDLERATFSNIEHLSIEFVTAAVLPYLTCICQAVDRDLIPDEEILDGGFLQLRQVVAARR